MQLNDENIIYSYTRAQALEDGELIDLSGLIRGLSRLFNYPVAVTRTVYSAYIENSEIEPFIGATKIAYALFHAIRALPHHDDDIIVFDRYRKPASALKGELKALVHGGDDGEPVITIMLPDED